MSDSYVNFLSAELYADISGMKAENKQRELLGESMAYTDEDFWTVREMYRKQLEEYQKSLIKYR